MLTTSLSVCLQLTDWLTTKIHIQNWNYRLIWLLVMVHGNHYSSENGNVFLALELWTNFSEIFILTYLPLIFAKMGSPTTQICWWIPALTNLRTILQMNHTKNDTMKPCAGILLRYPHKWIGIFFFFILFTEQTNQVVRSYMARLFASVWCLLINKRISIDSALLKLSGNCTARAQSDRTILCDFIFSDIYLEMVRVQCSYVHHPIRRCEAFANNISRIQTLPTHKLLITETIISKLYNQICIK